MRLAILRTGAPAPELVARRGGYEHWFAARLGLDITDIDVIGAVTDEPLPPLDTLGGLIVTGSPHSVHDHAPWSLRATVWLRRAVDAGVPTLAVCYGHQMLGEAYGGAVGKNPNGREIGTTTVDLYTDDPLFEGLPRKLPVITTHSDAVNVPPPGARVLAGNANTPIQAMAIGDHCRTVQWHPEMDADIIRAIIDSRAAAIDAEMGPGAAARLRDAAVDCDSGAVILHNFARHWLKR